MILGLVGIKDSGKGTVGNIIQNKFEYVTESFAGPVKDITSILFNWDRKLLEGDTEESRIFRETKDDWWSTQLGYDISPRLAMQLVGTNSIRDRIHSKMWIYSLENRIDPNKNYIITDVRFPNELDWIKSLGGKNISIIRDPLPEWYWDAHSDNMRNTTKMEDNYPDIHISEWAHIGYTFDYMIQNNSTLEDLENKVYNMFQFFDGLKDSKLNGK
jgi:hypothetical protein